MPLCLQVLGYSVKELVVHLPLPQRQQPGKQLNLQLQPDDPLEVQIDLTENQTRKINQQLLQVCYHTIHILVMQGRDIGI